MRLQRARIVLPSSAAPVQPPPNGPASSSPHLTMSPIVPSTGQPTTGGLVCIIESDNPIGGLVVWKRDAASGYWGALATFSNPRPFVWLPIFTNACELYFQIENPRNHILFEETHGLAQNIDEGFRPS